MIPHPAHPSHAVGKVVHPFFEPTTKLRQLITITVLCASMVTPPRVVACDDDPIMMDPFEVNEPPYEEPDWPDIDIDWPDTEDTGGGGGGGEDDTCSGTSCDTCDSSNKFHPADGNAVRRITDLKLHGARAGNLLWTRHHTTIPRTGPKYFGLGGSWRHGWQYDLIQYPTELGSDLELIYPDGTRRVFRAQGSGSWVIAPEFTETITATSAGFVITTFNGAELTFVARPDLDRGTGYNLTHYVDYRGWSAELVYNDAGYLQRVTEQNGRFFDLSYTDAPFRKGAWTDLAQVDAVPAQGAWIELRPTLSDPNTAQELVRLQGAVGVNLHLAEVQVFSSDSAEPLKGTLTSSGLSPEAALDGNPATFFEGQQDGRDHWSLKLATPAVISLIRILPAAGSEAALSQLQVAGMRTVEATRAVVVRVTGSDGRHVDYDYAPLAEPQSGREYLALTAVHYGDGTGSTYRYEFVSAANRPLLVEADDARYTGKAKRIHYSYHPDRVGMIHQEINPVSGAVYATLETDPQNPGARRVIYTDFREIVYQFDAKGRLQERTDSLGRRHRFEYDQKNRRVAHIEPDGQRTEISYDDAGRVKTRQRGVKLDAEIQRDFRGKITSKRDRSGRQTHLTYDEKGRLRSIAKPDGSRRTYTRDSSGRVTSVQENEDSPRAIRYDQDGRISAYTDNRGQINQLAYDEFDRVVAWTDAIGRVKRYAYNDRDQVTRITFPDGRTQSFAYDAYGRKTSETDHLSRSIRYAYDELGRIIEMVDKTGGVTKYDYADLPQGCSSCSLANQASRIEHPDGTITTNLFDTEGRLLARTTAAGTPAQATTLFSYDEDSRLVAVTDPLGRVTRHTYDEDGRRTSTTDPAGLVTTWTYDAHGNVTSTTVPSGAVTRYTYDDADRVTSITNALGERTQQRHNADGQVTLVIDPDGKRTRHRYENGHRVATIHPDGTHEAWDYDAVGRVMRTRNADGLETDFTYDSGDRVLTQRDSTGRITRYDYDALGQRIAATDPLGRTTRWTYDDRGNIESTIRADGAVAFKEYNPFDQVIAETDEVGNTTRYGYDEARNLASLTDARGSTYRFTYDAAHRRTGMIYPGNSSESWTYDLAGQQVSFTNRSGQTKTTTYNAAGKALAETWSPAGAAPDTTYRYDAAGRLEALSNGQTTLSYSYDTLGRLAAETQDITALVPGLENHTVGYAYDPRGRLATLIYPDQTRVNYTYDARGRMETITDGPGRPVARYRYDELGRIAGLERENRVDTTYTYDAANQLLVVAHNRGREVVASAQYELDTLGRRIAQTREDNLTDRYTYDLIGQLTSTEVDRPISNQPTAEAFDYDPVGNRTGASATLGGATSANVQTYTTNALNQYVSISSQAAGLTNQVTGLTYDLNGNLLGDGTQSYRYDAQNRLVEVESATIRAEFFYDARNRCVLRRYYTRGGQGHWDINPSGSLTLTYDNKWNLLNERTQDGGLRGSYIHGIRTDEIISRKQSHLIVYPLADALGNTVALTNDKGVVQERYRYTAFGRPIIMDSNLSPLSAHDSPHLEFRFLFTGREWLRPVAITDHRNRYYAPEIGRWLCPDPIKQAGGVNLYAYVSNSPGNNSDPQGLCECKTWGGYFEECMSLNGLPTPTGIFDSIASVTTLVSTITGAVAHLGSGATMAEVFLTAPTTAVLLGDAAVVVGALSASYYTGVALSCSAHSLGEVIGDYWIGSCN